MNKKVLSLVAVLSLLTLAGCKNQNQTHSIVAESAAALKPMQQSYRGVLPCADCEGIDTSLFLDASGTWIMNQAYQGREATYAAYGTWARTADRLILTDSEGEKTYFLPKDDSLVMLDAGGRPIPSSLNYTLKAVQLDLPVTPMSMTGEYTYLADAAVFKACNSGKIYPVAENAALQNAYLTARGKSQSIEPVLLQFKAHFARQPQPDSGRQQYVLVADDAFTFTPGKSCKN